MKNLCIVTGILLLLATDAFSQLSIGISTGFNLSTLRLDDDDSKEFRKMIPGVVSGIVIDAGDDIGISTGLMISMQGLKFKDDQTSEMIRTTYLKIPLMAKANIGRPGKSISGFVNLGPYVAFWLKARYIAIVQGTKVSENLEFDSDYNNRLDVGFTIGGGVSIKKDNQIIQIGPGFSMGVLDVNKYPGGKPQGVKSYLNMVAGVINVNYLFQMKKNKGVPATGR